MSGFPTRHSLDGFGPHPRRNFGNVRGNDANCLNDNYLNLMHWQLAGANLMVPKAWFVFDTVNGADPTMIEHHEAWRPKDDGPAPTALRTGEGVWTFTYAATVKDMDGVDVSPGLRYAEPSLQADTADAQLRARCTAENVVKVVLYQTNVAQDLPGSRILVVVR